MMFVNEVHISINGGTDIIVSPDGGNIVGIIDTKLNSDVILTLFIQLEKSTGNPVPNDSDQNPNVMKNRKRKPNMNNQQINRKTADTSGSPGTSRSYSTKIYLDEEDVRLGNFKYIRILYKGGTHVFVVPSLLKLTRVNINKLCTSLQT